MELRSMTDVAKRAAAKHFVEVWTGKGYEKGESQKFWLSLLSDVMGVEHASEVITFEDQVHLDHTSFIDGFIPQTHVLIEQKSLGKSLTAAIKQSDGTMLSPIQQALRYVDALLHEKGRQAVPRWIVTCNFEEFRVYDMDHPQNEAQVIRLCDLEKEYHRLRFLVDTGSENLRREMQISLDAGRLVGKLYDALLKQYKDPTSESTLKSLNALCVRLVFCLYAEDAGIFEHLMFHDYVKAHTPQQARKALVSLFRVLDQKPEERDPYLADDEPLLAAVLGADYAERYDRFELAQLAEVLRVCARSKTLSEAGRALFAVSRLAKKSANDADRLSRYLLHYNIPFAKIPKS